METSAKIPFFPILARRALYIPPGRLPEAEYLASGNRRVSLRIFGTRSFSTMQHACVKQDVEPRFAQTEICIDFMDLDFSLLPTHSFYIILQLTDPHKASYGIEDYFFAVTQLAQTTMRSELGKLTLDKVFQERETLNTKIVCKYHVY